MSGLYPFSESAPYGAAAFGGRPRGPTLADLVLVPPIHLPHRLSDMARLAREPTPYDVATQTTLGGIPAALPLIVPAMGSTTVAHRHGEVVSRAAAKAGVPLVLGENIAAVHGYGERQSPDVPCFKERLMAYLDELGPAEALGDKPGGVAIQQSVEDAMDELWWRIYTDPDVEPYIRAGRVAFEVKVGQGAKPGLGGLTLLSPADAARLADDFHMEGGVIEDGHVERFSAPGTFTYDILEAQMRHIKNDFPHVQIWVKMPPSRDLVAASHACVAGGAQLITFDGAEAGTALAPNVFLHHVGLPTLAVAAAIRRDPPPCDTILSGGLRSGADIAKARALGFAGAALGRAVLEAAIAGPEALEAAFADVRKEVAMITYALGHLDQEAIAPEALMSADQSVAAALGIAWTLAPPLPTVITAEAI